jgi:hypothetical protein
MEVSSLLVAPEGSGVVTKAQLVPSHCSVSDFWMPAESKYVPTALQVVLMHETPAKELKVAPPGKGTVTMDHAEPFHWTASGLVMPVESE